MSGNLGSDLENRPEVACVAWAGQAATRLLRSASALRVTLPVCCGSRSNMAGRRPSGPSKRPETHPPVDHRRLHGLVQEQRQEHLQLFDYVLASQVSPPC